MVCWIRKKNGGRVFKRKKGERIGVGRNEEGGDGGGECGIGDD